MKKLPIKIIDGNNIILQPFSEKFLTDNYLDWMNDKETTKFISKAKKENSMYDLELFVKHMIKSNLDYFTEENIKNWKHKKVDTPEKNDVLIFKVRSNTANHCGVFLGNDVFYHHAENRLSCRENLYPFWAEHLVGIYRYVA